MQVHKGIDFIFARALRGMLRHDLDVMLIGEIRDRETADIAIRCALTGHLVFETLHTNDAVRGITRLLDIRIEPFLLANSINGIVTQRLVRHVCPKCRRARRLETLDELERHMLTEFGVVEDASLWKGEGCEHCRVSGY